MNRSNLITWVFCFLGLVPIAAQVHASTLTPTSTQSPSVLYSTSQLLTSSAANTFALSAPSAGQLFLSLTDLDFPNPFASLKFTVTDTQKALIGLVNAGTLTLSVPGPTTLYADVFAKTASTGGPGLYNFTATFMSAAPVGLPGTGGLLGAVTALAIGLELIWRRRAHATVTTAVA